MKIDEVLTRIPMLSGLSREEIFEIAREGSERAMLSGEVIFRQGDVGDALYVVLEGSVRMHAEAEGHELELGIEKPGDFFGEMSLLGGGARSAGAVVGESGRLFRLDRATFLALLSRSPPMLRELLARLMKNLRESNAHRLGLSQEKEALRTRAELERLRSLSQMVAGLAHEINTPLGIIQNAASLTTELLTQETIPEVARDAEGREILGDIVSCNLLIQKNASHASRLVQTFKSLSVRQITDCREKVDLLTVLREALDLYRLKARASGLVLKVVCDLAPEQRVWDGYPGHLAQVLLNFLTNAERYAYPGVMGGVVEVSLVTREHRPRGAGFALTVRDFGRGIPEENLVRVFEPFFTTGRDQDGTGLGLAIVHNLVTQALGGTIRVESSPGEGTAFHLWFPQKVPEGERL